jgi:hypothetical protein
MLTSIKGALYCRCGRGTPTDVQQLEIETSLRTGLENSRGVPDGGGPSTWLSLLRPDVERHADGPHTKRARPWEEICGHFRNTAEFAGEWPFGTFVFDQKTAVDLRTRRG